MEPEHHSAAYLLPGPATGKEDKERTKNENLWVEAKTIKWNTKER